MQYIAQTEHLGLRRFRLEDAARLYEIHRDEEVQKWIPNESYHDLNEARDAALFFADRVDRADLPMCWPWK